MAVAQCERPPGETSDNKVRAPGSAGRRPKSYPPEFRGRILQPNGFGAVGASGRWAFRAQVGGNAKSLIDAISLSLRRLGTRKAHSAWFLFSAEHGGFQSRCRLLGSILFTATGLSLVPPAIKTLPLFGRVTV